MHNFCREYNGGFGLMDVKCYFYHVWENPMRGYCMEGNFEFEIPLKEEDLVDAKYVICDKCPIADK